MKPLLAIPFLLLGLANPAAAEQLNFTAGGVLDVSALGLSSIGDLAYERGPNKLWVCDGSVNGQVFEIAPSTGALVSQFSPAAIPGLAFGPDALAIAPSGAAPNLFVFSSFNESRGGQVTQTGGLVVNYGTSHGATGADLNAAGDLWIATGTTGGGGSILRRINPATGAILESVPILSHTQRVVDLTFDPVSGGCYCLLEISNLLVEISLSTGATLSTTDLTPFLSSAIGVAGGIDFGIDGSVLFVAGNNPSQITVLNRDYDRTVCDGSGVSVPCPCGNAGIAGRGCDNSFTTGGARVDTDGLPRVASDSLRLVADGMPPSTTCLFFQGTNTHGGTIVDFGDGLRCVFGTVIRLGTKPTVNGTAEYPGFFDATISVRGAIPAVGATRFYQVWYRNIAPFCTPEGFNVSNGVEVQWIP